MRKLYIAAAILFIGLVGLGWAVEQLPPPVSQNLGISDTTLFTWTESGCRGCHDSTTLGGVPTRHHSLQQNGVINPSTGQLFGCLDCHHFFQVLMDQRWYLIGIVRVAIMVQHSMQIQQR